jgi:hypothetical protein
MTILTNITLIYGALWQYISYAKTYRQYGFHVGVLVIEKKTLRMVAARSEQRIQGNILSLYVR